MRNKKETTRSIKVFLNRTIIMRNKTINAKIYVSVRVLFLEVEAAGL